jgi:hypothetical protein
MVQNGSSSDQAPEGNMAQATTRSALDRLQLTPEFGLRVTPAMEAGITDHIFTLRELLA